MTFLVTQDRLSLIIKIPQGLRYIREDMDYMFRQQLENDKPIRFNNGIEVRNKRNWLTNWWEEVKSNFFLWLLMRD